MSKLLPDWQGAAVLEAVFEHLPEPYLLYDDKLTIAGLNSAAEHLIGRSAGDLTGRRCADAFRCTVCEPECGIRLGLRDSNNGSATIRMFGADGRARVAIVRTAVVFAEAGRRGVVAQIADISEQQVQPEEVIAESPVMRDIMSFVRRIATSNASAILIEGEHGTGKDRIAKTLHHLSARSVEPFINVNCAAITETLFESELFGHEKSPSGEGGSGKRGLVEVADRGTLFLDEVADVPLALQPRLLTLIEEQKFRRPGGLDDLPVNLRVIAASDKNLRELVQEGAFLQDLYMRLNVIQLVIPPLRERAEDVLPLARQYMRHYNRKFKRNIEQISPEAERGLLAYNWPCNVRELRNVIERAMILEETSTLTVNSLPLPVSGIDRKITAAPGCAQVLEAGISLAENERMLLKTALERTGGNQTQAAHLLGITRDTLRYRMKKFSLN